MNQTENNIVEVYIPNTGFYGKFKYDKKQEELVEINKDGECMCNNCYMNFEMNWCFRCNKSNICEDCEGYGGDYGETEEWVCNDCLPRCISCDKKLYQRDNKCCGVGRSDDPQNSFQWEKPILGPKLKRQKR
tara:strand:+ start:76 stop:471 length:396 start_codon:yes stop_codon:yes gene_type:complete